MTAESELLVDANVDIGRLYDEHAPRVQRFLLGLRLRLDRSAIEDAVQETFLRLIRLLREPGASPSYDGSRPLGPYILGVARHVALDLCRRRPAVRLLEPHVSFATSGEPDAARSLEQRDLVERAMSALAPEQRTALVLRHVNGLPMEELATALDCSVPTARSRVENAARLFALELRRTGLERKELSS